MSRNPLTLKPTQSLAAGRVVRVVGCWDATQGELAHGKTRTGIIQRALPLLFLPRAEKLAEQPITPGGSNLLPSPPSLAARRQLAPRQNSVYGYSPLLRSSRTRSGEKRENWSAVSCTSATSNVLYSGDFLKPYTEFCHRLSRPCCMRGCCACRVRCGEIRPSFRVMLGSSLSDGEKRATELAKRP